MAKKRSKKPSRKSSRARSMSSKPEKRVIASDKKISLVVKNMVSFLILLVLSVGLYFVSSSELWRNFFWITGLISGFVLISFLIVYLTLLFLKMFNK